MIFPAFALALAITAAGCASVGSPERSALSAAEQLTPQPDGTRAWRSPEVRVTAFFLADDALDISAQLTVDGEQRTALRRAFAQSLVKALRDGGLRQAEAVGPGVVEVRGTITEIALASPGLNALTTLLLLAPLSRGGVAMDVEARAADGGARVAALSFKGQAGANNVGSAFSGIGHAELQTGLAARKFADLLLQRAPRPALPSAS